VNNVPQKRIDNPDYYKKHPEFRNLVRIMGTSVEGSRLLGFGLSQVRGVGRRLAQAIIRVSGYDENTRVGLLTEEDVSKLEEIMKDPIKFGIPEWMVNRQKDLRTGKNLHYVGNELELMARTDVERMKRTRSWKGIRHALHLKVRGQRTRTTGRTGLVVGYLRLKKKTEAKK
jgi:small subunit ribosomal protein S13